MTIAIIEPSEVHYYQPGWTMVGAGVFDPEFTRRSEASVMPGGVDMDQARRPSGFAPDENKVLLCDGSAVALPRAGRLPRHQARLGCHPGLPETLGKNGVTSNYRYDLAPYTNRLVKEFKGGRALFTQPPMPIKCAGAPQKAMYLSCHRWEKAGVLKDIDVQFHNAGAVLFGVAAYVPALMEYVERYGAQLNSNRSWSPSTARPRWPPSSKARRWCTRVEEQFDMIHVVPPQVAPDFVRASPLAAASALSRSTRPRCSIRAIANVFALGDACSASNAKTDGRRAQAGAGGGGQCAGRAEGKPPVADYDGYGSCPLTVEAARSCWPSSAMAANCCRVSRTG